MLWMLSPSRTAAVCPCSCWAEEATFWSRTRVSRDWSCEFACAASGLRTVIGPGSRPSAQERIGTPSYCGACSAIGPALNV